VTQVSLVSQVQPELKVNKGHEVILEKLVPREKQVPLVRQDLLVQTMVLQVQQDPPGLKVYKDYRVFKVHQEHKVPQVLRVFKDLLDQQDPPGLKVLKDYRVFKDLLVHKVLKDYRVFKDQPVQQVLLL